MKRIALANRILSLGLAVALAASSPMSVYAGEDTDASVETSIQISEGATSGDGGSSDVSDGSESGQPESGDALIDASQAADTQTDGDGLVNTIADEIKNDIADEGTPAADTPVVDADEKASDDEAGETPAEDGEEVTDEETEPEDAEPTSEEEDAEECEHVFGEWTSNENGTHSRTCSECGEVETETCDYDEDGVCKICGYKKAEEEPEIEYTYTSNGDGTHTKKWVTIDEEGNEVPHEEIEECEFDENGICIHCGQEKVEEEEDQEFTAIVGEYTIKVLVPAGAFDFDVTFEAEETTLTETEEQLVEETVEEDEYITTVVFDLRFIHDGEEVEPNEGYNISVSIESPNVQADDIVHIIDEDNAELISIDNEEGSVDFELDSFSKAALVNYGISDTSMILYDDTAYGSAYTTNHGWYAIATVKSGKDNKDAYPVQIQYENAANETTRIAPDVNSSEKCFLYGNSTLYVNFVAPENYYIEKVTLTRKKNNESTTVHQPGNNGVNTVFYPGTSYAQKISFSATSLTKKGQNSAYRNIFKVSLKKIPTTLTNETTVVNGATLVNYVDKTTSFGNDFKFLTDTNNASPASNAVHYGQVYQGLANTNLSNGVFKTTNGNTTLFFPSSEQYNSSQYSSYITSGSCYNNVGVVFTKDSNGYWTIDSSQRGYRYNSSNNKLEAVNTVDKDSDGSTAFRPFGTGSGQKDHYGMYLPISFAVNDSCTTNGEDTVFKFSGDDDVFVYIDGKLVLDMGGIHNVIDGQINFNTGEILIQGYTQKNIKNVPYETGLTSSTDDTVFNGAGRTNSGLKLYDILGVSKSDFTKNQNHTLTVVYFERGGHRSNCKIAFNFYKNETRTVEYEGLKVKEDGITPLQGAQFALYTDSFCTQLAKDGKGVDAIAVSDSSGTIKFEDISAGVLTSGSPSVSKEYYMKEIAAPDGYIKPDNAVWKLVLTASTNGSESVLTAITDDARSLSLTSDKTAVTDSQPEVDSIKNKLEYRTLSVKKVVSNSKNDSSYVDNNRFGFKLYQKVNGSWQPLDGASYSLSSGGTVTSTSTTVGGGIFTLGNQETVVFNNLQSGQYKIEEYGTNYANDYELVDYITNIYDDPSNQVIESTNRSVEIDLTATYEKAIRYENILQISNDWKLIKKSSSTKKVIDGAKFKLQSMDGSTIYYGQSEQTGIVKWYSDDNYSQEATVVDGEYTLQEIAAPNGYSLSVDSWTISIDRVHGIDAYKSVAGDLSNQIRTTSDGNTTMVEFTFYNDVVYTLPETGGRGVYVYTIGGVLLMLGASLMLYKNKKNHKKAKI